MKRRALLQHTALAAGAVMASPAMSALGTSTRTDRGTALLARLEDSAHGPHWLPWSECSSECAAAGLRDIRIDSIAFPESSQRTSVDAVFATDVGPKPFRIASLQRDSISPLSKPFAFVADAQALLGFQVEQHVQGDDRTSVAAVALLDTRRQRLVPGRYLLAMAPDCDTLELSRIVRAMPVSHTAKPPITIASIEFSVLSPKIG
jgi:hypothetical protein